MASWTGVGGMVFQERGRLGVPVSVIVPLPEQVYCDLWRVIRPQDRYSLNPAMKEGLCSGPDSPVYVMEEYSPGAGEAGVTRLPFHVVNTQAKERIVAKLHAFLATHPWLYPPEKSRNPFFALASWYDDLAKKVIERATKITETWALARGSVGD